MSTRIDNTITALMNVASDDDTRQNLTGVYFEKDGSAVVACDGHCLVKRTMQPDDVNGFRGKIVKLPAKLKFLAKTLAYELFSETGAAEMQKSNSLNPFDIVDGQYPDYKQVIPESEKLTRAFTVDANLIAAVVKAMDVQPDKLSKRRSVTFHFDPNNDLSPVKVTCGDRQVFGIIMPMRTE